MDSFYSLGGLPSLAIIQLVMNWKTFASYFPALDRFISEQINIEDSTRRFLDTWPGYLIMGTLCMFIILQLLHVLWKQARLFMLRNWRVKYSIPTEHPSCDRVRRWLANHSRSHTFSDFTVPPEDDILPVDYTAPIDGVDFSDGQDSLKVKFQKPKDLDYYPDADLVSFWYDGAYFWFEERKQKKLDRFHDHEVPDDYLDIFAFTWNRSHGPIKNLLRTIQTADHGETTGPPVTAILGPRGIGPNSRPMGPMWRNMRRRRSRPLETVIMDRVQREIIVDDVRTYLSTQGVGWYNDKGFPIRLGYLFHGPPGTGKSSLAFSLASHFGLPVHLLNLSTPGLTDLDVDDLFAQLPFHCMIVLEDIDATKPMQRDLKQDSDACPGSPRSEASDDSSWDQQGAPPLNQANKKPARNSVTLSGLLNAIDGVGAAEGRILILSTNDIDALDPALIRPGRADRIVEFTNTTKEQAEDMFLAAYTGERWVHSPSRPGAPRPVAEEWTDGEIRALARAFGDRIRDGAFSPAILQQYFKDFRAEPRRALGELDRWMGDPRGYRKPVVKILHADDGPVAADSEKLQSRAGELLGAEDEKTSALEDLMSFDDLGGYKEPQCFDPDADGKVVHPYGPLLDISNT